jgi:hypothetical protein
MTTTQNQMGDQVKNNNKKEREEEVYRLMSQEFGPMNPADADYNNGPYWYIDKQTIVAYDGEEFIIFDNYIDHPEDSDPRFLNCEVSPDGSFSINKIKDLILEFRKQDR